MSIYDDPAILIYVCFVTAVLGLVFGSFLNCAAWRIARGESFITGRSRCVHCGHTLGAIDLIPIVSWVLSGGKCRYCKAPVSIRYPLTELTFAVLAVLCVLQCDLTVLCLRNLIFLGALFCLSLVDLDSYIIPDGCLIAAVLAWAAAIPFAPASYGGIAGILFSLLSALVYGGGILLFALVMDKVLQKESMGGGDIKLFAVMGLYLGMVASLFAMFLACVLGLLFTLLQPKKESPQIPFGPAIAIAAWGMLLYGQPLVDWYLGLL